MSFRPPYRYITAPSLASRLHRSTALPRTDIAIVDVRDDDFQGGNIVGCINVPSGVFPDRVAELVRELREVPTVIFHCALSQARGPKSARIYAEVRQALLEQGNVGPVSSSSSVSEGDGEGDGDGDGTKPSGGTSGTDSPVEGQGSGEDQTQSLGGQRVLVLREGFSNFGRVYKDDPKLVEKYDEEAWSYR